MNSLLTDLYVLLTSRVPLPRNTMLFGLMTMIAYTLFSPLQDFFAEIGLVLPMLCAMFGYLTVVSLNLDSAVRELADTGCKNIGPKAFAVPFAACALAVFAPSLIWAQHAISVLLALTAVVFIYVNYVKVAAETGSPTLDEARRNAANWQIARLVAMILGNETVARTGTPTDWVVAMSLGPVALHYLMYWTIIATHPYDAAASGRDLDD